MCELVRDVGERVLHFPVSVSVLFGSGWAELERLLLASQLLASRLVAGVNWWEIPGKRGVGCR